MGLCKKSTTGANHRANASPGHHERDFQFHIGGKVLQENAEPQKRDLYRQNQGNTEVHLDSAF
jgi:hypothetical protein